MNYVFLVVASRGGNSVRGEMIIAAYDDRQAAGDHAEYINGVDNKFTASVTFMPLYNKFLREQNVGMKGIAYFERRVDVR